MTYKILVMRNPDGQVRKPPTTQFYSDVDSCLRDAAKLRRAGYRVEVWSISV